jgi:hypothetical protein
MNPSGWILVFSVFAFSAYDIFAATKWGYHGTLSYDILNASFSHPILPFAAGVLCGHLFFPQGRP